MTETTEKRGPGRPKKGPQKTIRLETEWWAWLKSQPGSYSDTVLAALKEYRERHQ